MAGSSYALTASELVNQEPIRKKLIYYRLKPTKRYMEASMRGKNVWKIGKPPAPNSVPYVPQHIDGRPAM